MTDEEIPGLWRCLRENHLLLGLSGLLCCFLSSSLHSFKIEQISLTFYNINNNPQLCTISNDFINQELFSTKYLLSSTYIFLNEDWFWNGNHLQMQYFDKTKESRLCIPLESLHSFLYIPFFAPAFFAAFFGDLGFVSFFGCAESLKLNKISKNLTFARHDKKIFKLHEKNCG